MAIINETLITEQTKKWITDVVVGCGFCPFASREIKRSSVNYEILFDATLKTAMEAAMRLMYQLDKDTKIATSFLIIPENFNNFDTYLELVEMTSALLKKEKYTGIYQVASFHPDYLFAGTDASDPSNYTNRSPYPMLHFLREKAVSKAIDSYPGVDEIPARNIAFAREKGLPFMQELFSTSFKIEGHL